MSIQCFKRCLLFIILIAIILMQIYFILWYNLALGAHEEDVTECNIPVLNPFDASIMPYFKQVKIKCKNPKPHLLKSSLDYLTIVDDKYLKTSRLNCCYVPYKIMGMQKLANYCVDFKGKTKMKHEFAKVECKYENFVVYSDYMNFVLPISKFRPVKKNSNHLNVAVLMLDGVSRMAFHRQLPKTKQYLHTLGAIEFTKFMRVGEDTLLNIFPLLTGHAVGDHPCWRKLSDPFDTCPFIWKRFSKKNFLTAFVEDAGDTDSFSFEKRGFNSQPVDYYWRPFDLLLNINDSASNVKTSVSPCAGDVPLYKSFLSYTTSFLQRMLMDKQKFIGFFLCNSASHDDNAMLSSIDEDLRDFLKEAKRSGTLKNTVVFFLSDHGTRHGDLRRTFQGFFESNLPFMFVYLPEQFRNTYLSLYSVFEGNADRLTTVYDVHETLKDIADLNFGNQVSQGKGISLFRKLPISRTCEESGIPTEFCVCAKSYVTVQDRAVETAAANSVLSYLNELLSLSGKCAVLILNEILDVRYVKYLSKKVNLYQLKALISTRPGTGLFEAILQEVHGNYEVLGTVSRLSVYGRESSCVKNTTLKLYCYCQK